MSSFFNKMKKYAYYFNGISPWVILWCCFLSMPLGAMGFLFKIPIFIKAAIYLGYLMGVVIFFAVLTTLILPDDSYY